jgi:hypothetical protein
MSFKEKTRGDLARPIPDEVLDPALKEAVGNFRQSVCAWSEAAYSRPRTAVQIAARKSWRMAVGWALGCVLAAGSLGGGLYERDHRQAVARVAAQLRLARERKLAAQQRARQADEDLLATVDSDVSREVPVALEPLAQLMDSDGNQ